jgi:hypothetical protein
VPIVGLAEQGVPTDWLNRGNFRILVRKIVCSIYDCWLLQPAAERRRSAVIARFDSGTLAALEVGT